MITKNNEVNMKEYLILELKRLLKKDIEYSRSDIQKVLNNIKELDYVGSKSICNSKSSY